MINLKKDSSILVTGANGLVGSAVVNLLRERGFTGVHPVARSHGDLLSLDETKAIFERFRPEYVFHNAARVYGIWGNMNNKALSFYDNLLINTNVIAASQLNGVKKICAMGTGAVYPFPAPSEFLNEEDIFMGQPHPAEDSYAQAKRAMLSMLRAYEESYGLQWAFVVSCNLFGPRDKFDTENGHVTPSLIKKFYNKKYNGEDLVVWGDGSSQRDFMYVEDAAEALLMIMLGASGPINLGSGQVSSIGNVVKALCEISDINPDQIKWNKDMPNGQDYRAYNLQKLASLGFVAHHSLKMGLQKTWDWYVENPQQ